MEAKQKGKEDTSGKEDTHLCIHVYIYIFMFYHDTM